MGISREQIQTLARVAREIGLVFIVAFGSAARGESRPDSDLDIAILTTRDPDYELFQNAFGAISDVFRGQNVDLRFLNGADPLFTMQVVRDGVLLFGDPDEYDAFRIFTNKRYIDDGMKYFPLFETLLDEQQARLEAKVYGRPTDGKE